MATRFIGSGRLREGGFAAVHKQDFEAHRTGGDWRHTASHVDVTALANIPGSTVQTVLENIDTAIYGYQIVTVGDGINTFGTYNGADAIYQAWQAAGTKSLVVFVKPGDYSITDLTAINITSLKNLALIGYQGNSVTTASAIIYDNRSGLLNGAINVGGGFYCQNITFSRGTGIGASVRIFGSGLQQSVIFDNCYFYNTGVKVCKTPGNIRFNDCNFSNNVALDGNSFCNISPEYVGRMYGILFDNCTFSIGGYGVTAATIRGTAIGYLNPYILDYLRFEKCRFTVKCQTLAILNDTRTVSVLSVIKAAGGPSSGEFYISEIAFEDCEVFGDKDPAFPGTVYSMLLYLVVDPDIILDKLIISGGEWITRQSGRSTYTAPIYIGSTDPFDGSNIKSVLVENVEFGWGNLLPVGTEPLWETDNTKYGSFPAELAWTLLEQDWNAIVISADNIRINNLQFRGCTQVGTTSGEIGLIPVTSLDVDGVYINDFTGSISMAVVQPYGRFNVFEPVSVRAFINIKDVHIDFGIRVALGGGAGIRTVPIGVNPTGIFTFDSCQVWNNLYIGNSAIYGFLFSPGYGEYRLYNCSTKYNVYGVYLNGSVPRINIKDGKYIAGTEHGIYIRTATFTAESSVSIDGNLIELTNVSGTNKYGLQLECIDHDGYNGWMVTNNIVRNNGIHNAGAPQIAIASSGVSSNIVATILGNNCAGNNYTGSIRFTKGTGDYYIIGGNVNGQIWKFGEDPPVGSDGHLMDLNLAILDVV